MERLDAAEAKLGLRLPEELRSLYRVSDGVFDAGGQWFVIWPLDVLVEENLRRHEAGLLPEDLVAFGDDGTGNPFCVEVGGPSGVNCWHPIDASKDRLARDVAEFWRGWTAGTILT